MTSNQELNEISERLSKLQKEDLGLDPIKVLTIFINNLLYFRFDNPDEARIKIEKKSQTTPEPPSSTIGGHGSSSSNL